MSRPDAYSFERYLAAKRTVDDRALHRPTLDRLSAGLAERAAESDGPISVLEVGAGIGTMLRRLLSWNRLPDDVAYTAVDLDPGLIDAARERLADWARERGYRTAPADGGFRLRRDGATVAVEFVAADAFDFAARVDGDREWDALVACAFLDLVDLRPALSALFPLVSPGGRCYFPITFDGETRFEPVPDPAFERKLTDAYHATMDAPDRPGCSETGRKLPSAVGDCGGEVLASGRSDWVVEPPYPADEAYFLHHIVDTVEGAVADAIDAGDAAGIDRGDLRAWADDRHAAVERGELRYETRQIDLLGRVP
ncbi:class I SAM-dependent methyltransferase [Halegenticoccus soli]|uniref:class I SAM-dependent methyltransferase n=1 Tax=Halegenticoccus soli TaxID=1985678 RepID=UPI000C6D7A11|nr:class I SAM-dependent methyltransferase [Halegenticoccus soli]